MKCKDFQENTFLYKIRLGFCIINSKYQLNLPTLNVKLIHVDISIDTFNRLPHFEQEELVQTKASSLYTSKDFGEYAMR